MAQNKLLSVFAMIGLLGGLALSTTACAGVAEQAIEQAVKDTTGADVDVDAGGGVSLPSDFPSDVPVIDAKLTSAVSIPTGESKTWTITFEVSDPDTAFTEASQKLTDAGFSEAVTEVSGTKVGTYDNGSWSVSVTSTQGAIAYAVMPSVM